MKLDTIGAIEACYSGVEDDATWLRDILGALAPLDQGAGMFAQVFRMEPDGRRPVEASVESLALAPGALHRVDASFTTFGRPAEMWTAMAPVDFALRRARQVGARAHREVARLFASEGLEDTLGIFAAEPDGRIALVGAPIRSGARHLGGRWLHQLRMFSAHLGSSMRLRRATSPRGPDAVLDPGGKVLDAFPGASGAARTSLSDAVRRLNRARGPLRHADPDEALQLWQGLVDGTWSLVDQCDRDGKHYVLARRNAPHVRDPKALTDRERAVLAFAALGHQNKFIAYLLGLSPSAVATHLASARRKLGLSSRSELLREFASLVRARPDESSPARPPGA
ncbi:MAG TPA: LuxR C-terminal-related transcriptional regulator [Anaeromyxobacter sp.]